MTDSLRTIRVQEALLSKNRSIAERLRRRFQEAGVQAVNLLSSRGSGKTTLLERTLSSLSRNTRAAVIVGDLATDNDGRRLAGKGAPIVQIQTGGICHLDAAMVERALAGLDLPSLDLLFLENVGNLVCPSAYDLGEARRVVLLSVTEGEDKPLKYPSAFRKADLVLITKADIAAAVEFQREAALEGLRRAAPGVPILEVSARTGQGMEAWLGWLESLLRQEAEP